MSSEVAGYWFQVTGHKKQMAKSKFQMTALDIEAHSLEFSC
jgi:hypothetical protein